MSKHLQRDLDRLKKGILTMGAMVEANLNDACSALTHRRSDLAQDVLERDSEIDDKEVEIESECLKLLALHQPVASDLRFIITVLKVNNDLERMGDLANHIAERANYLAQRDPIEVPAGFQRMVDRVLQMVARSLDALVNQDTRTARIVLEMDDQVDAVNREMYQKLQRSMRDEPKTIKRAINTLSASRHLERVADLATNVAEDVVFMVEGGLLRHRHEQYLGDDGPGDAEAGGGAERPAVSSAPQTAGVPARTGAAPKSSSQG